MSLPNGVSLLVGSSDLSDRENLKLRVTDTTPGGFDNCTFEVCYPDVPQWAAPVIVYDSTYSQALFIGRVMQVRNKGQAFSVTCKRQTRNQRFIPQEGFQKISWKAGRKVHDALIFGLSITPEVFDGGIIDPGFQFVQETKDYALLTAEDLWNDITTLTSGLSTPLLWWIWDTGSLAVLRISFLDLGTRYRTEINSDQYELVYDVESITNRSTQKWGQNQYSILPNPNGLFPINYDAIPIIRDKVASANGLVGTQEEAQALAGTYLARFSEFRPVSGQITLQQDRDSVRAVYPVVASPDDHYPLWLIRSGNYIEWTLRDFDYTRLKPYNIFRQLIVQKTYDFDTCTCQLTLGEIHTLDTDVNRITSFEVNRLFTAGIQSVVNEPNVNADGIPIFGPQYSGESPPSFSSGIPTMVLAPDNAIAIDGAVVHPNLIADMGLQANFTVGDLTSIGFKGAVRVIPGEFDEIEVLLGDDNGLVSDTCTIVLHKLVKGSSTTPVQLGSPLLLTAKRNPRVLQSPYILGQGDWILPEVRVASTTALWASISLHATKKYPGLPV